QMDLLIDLLALVEVGPMVGKRGFDLRVPQLHEWALPEPRWCGLRRDRRDLIVIDTSELAVDLEEDGHQITLCRPRFQLRCMFENLGDDAADEPVVELDLATLEGL